MSIYSGFATRAQEESYDSLLLDYIFVLEKRITKFYAGEAADETKFLAALNAIFTQITAMDKSKYLEPKVSQHIEEFISGMRAKNGDAIDDNASVTRKGYSQPLVHRSDRRSHKNEITIQSSPNQANIFGKIKHQMQLERDPIQPEKEIEHIKGRNKLGVIIAKSQEDGASSRIAAQIARDRRALSVPRTTHGKQPPVNIAKEFTAKANQDYLKGYRRRKVRGESSSYQRDWGHTNREITFG